MTTSNTPWNTSPGEDRRAGNGRERGRPLAELGATRRRLHGCFGPRADALFELTDALLTTGTVPSPPHLSLAPAHRRGWGSLYAALSKGRVDDRGLKDLLSRRPLEGGAPGDPQTYAVDVSVWPRCATPKRAPREDTTTIRPGTPQISP